MRIKVYPDGLRGILNLDVVEILRHRVIEGADSQISESPRRTYRREVTYSDESIPLAGKSGSA